jgi:hypothetical protein
MPDEPKVTEIYIRLTDNNFRVGWANDILNLNHKLLFRDFTTRHPCWYVHAKIYFTLISRTVITRTHTCKT